MYAYGTSGVSTQLIQAQVIGPQIIDLYWCLQNDRLTLGSLEKNTKHFSHLETN